MKKSEAIKIIVSVLEEFHDKENYDYEDPASLILYRLEQEGVCAPYIEAWGNLWEDEND